MTCLRQIAKIFGQSEREPLWILASVWSGQLLLGGCADRSEQAPRVMVSSQPGKHEKKQGNDSKFKPS